jgi:tetratricopeptide (TPR) repeat protein
MNIASRAWILGMAAIVLAVSSSFTRADQAPALANASSRIEQAYYRADISALVEIAGTLAAGQGDGSQTAKYVDYYIGYANYALANLLIGRDNGKAGDCLDKAEPALQRAIAADPGFAEAHALLAAVYGLEIALHPWKGMWLGRRIGKLMDRAEALAPHNPRITLLRAGNDYHKPAAFGGDKPQALLEFGQAIAEFAHDAPGDPDTPTWGKAEAYALRARAEAASGDEAAARRDYQAALALAPDYVAVRNALSKLPAEHEPRG